MMGVIKKFKDVLLGVDIEDDDDLYDEYEDDDYEDSGYEEPKSRTSALELKPRTEARARGTSHLRSVPSAGNVVDLHKKSQIDIILPQNIEDARDVIDNTRSNIISVVNLEGIDGAVAQRIADFLSGSVDALEGTIRRLSYDMFVIAPKGVEITGSISSEINEEIKGYGLSSSAWLSSAYK